MHHLFLKCQVRQGRLEELKLIELVLYCTRFQDSMSMSENNLYKRKRQKQVAGFRLKP